MMYFGFQVLYLLTMFLVNKFVNEVPVFLIFGHQGQSKFHNSFWAVAMIFISVKNVPF